MKRAKNIAPHPISQIRPGRVILDCSGPVHREWLQEALFVRGLKVMVYRRSFLSDQMDALPIHADLQMASGDLEVVLNRLKESLTLIVDDLGSFHFHERPLELLKAYYDALALDGEVWLRFPQTFFVFLESGRRISLQEYLVSKFPQVAKRLGRNELDPKFVNCASSNDGWVLIRKDRRLPKLFFNIVPRCNGGTSVPAGGSHAAYLEFAEKPLVGKRSWFRRAS